MRIIILIIFVLCTFASGAQDTSFVTQPVRHDSAVTTTLPESYICRDSTFEVLDTTYNAFFSYKFYTIVDGSIFATVTLCDTIAAHDTTFTISVVHDSTFIIITAHPVTLRPNNQTKAFGTVFTFTNNGTQISVTGGSLKPGDVLTIDNAASAGSVASAVAGIYAITLSAVTIMRGATNVTSTYAINYQFGSLTVSPAIPITIKADDQGKTAGQTFTFLGNGSQVEVVSGSLVSGDVITADNAASTGAGSGAAAGTYPITLSSVTIMRGGSDVTNQYNITYQTGILTVAAAPQIITVKARDQIKVYGNTFTFLGNGSQVQVTSGGLASGDVITIDNATSGGATSSAAVSSYTITLSSITIMNGATNVTGNYTITYQNGSMSVTARPITVRANNQTKTQGNTFTFLGNGSQVSITSGTLVAGHSITADNAASTGAASGAAVGGYPITLSSITISAPANVTSNYAITYQQGTLVVNAGTGQDIVYGIFPLTSPTYPNLQARIDHAKYVGVPVLRYNYDYNLEQYRVQDILDEGLDVALTWNHTRVRQANTAFPAGNQITFYANKLDSMLKLPGQKPQSLSINNEEGHKEYWPKGTATGYIQWFNACVTVAHNNNIPISNGGITSGIVYSLRQWYIDRSLPDSVEWLDNIWGIAGGNGTYVQEQIRWYDTLLTGFTNNTMDYVNLHWYEPERNNFEKLTTSKVLPKVVNYIRVRTGKPVLTTEIGTKNLDWGLLFEMMDEAKASDMKWIIYFAGDSNDRATDLSEAYRAWLMQ